MGLSLPENKIRWPFISNPSPENVSSTELVPLSPVESDTQDRPKAAQSPGVPLSWTPWPLRKLTLIVFAICFVLLAVILAILFGVSRRNQGLTPSKETLHYLWTYGPTAVLTIVVALWGQVEYRTKQLMPWQIMSVKPAPSKDTLWMDYISSWNVDALFTSFRAGHYPVSLAIAGTLLIKLLIVVSTGLFLLQPATIYDNNAQLMKTNKLDGSNYNPSAIDSRPFLGHYAAIAYHKDYQYGVNANYAYETFNLSSYADDAVLEGMVNVFDANLSCEILTNKTTIPTIKSQVTRHVQANQSTSIAVSKNFISIKAPNCHVRFPYEMNSVDSALPSAYFANCDGHTALGWRNATDSYKPDGKNKELMLVHFDSLNDMTAVYCKPSYEISRASVKIQAGNPSQAVLHFSPENTPRKLSHISDADILNGVRLATYHLPNEIVVSDGDGEDSTPLVFKAIKLDFMQTEELWEDPHVEMRQTRAMFRSVAAQVAKYRLFQPDQSLIDGRSIVQENRLQVSLVSFAIMEVVLAALVIITLSLFFIAPRDVTPRDPGSIGGLALLVARSEDVTSEFRGTGHLSLESLILVTTEQKFGTYSLSNSCSGDFRISKEGDAQMEEIESPKTISWWRPLSTTPVIQFIYFLAPIALIVSLEVLWEKSKSLHGIADINPSEYIQYSWVYIPAFTMFLVSTLFLMLDSTARIFQPYSLLRRQAVPAHTAITTQQLNKVALHSLWDSIKNSHLATAATSIAVILGGLLPIAVSGLYTTQMTAWEFPVSVKQTGDFNFTEKDKLNGQTSLGALILNANVSYPQWTYKELAFPSLVINDDSIDKLSSRKFNNTATLKLRVPAVRASIDCANLSYNTTFKHTKSIKKLDGSRDASLGDPSLPVISGVPGVQMRTNVHKDCSGKPNNFTWEFPYGYFGFMSSTLAIYQTNWMDCGADWILVYGYADKELSPQTNATVLFCNSHYETVETDLTLNLHSYTIDKTNPPITHENTTKFRVIVDNSNYGDRFLSGMQPINPSTPYSKTFDGFVDAMVYGIDGVPANELLNETRLQTRYKEVYGLIEAQRAGSQFRTDSSMLNHTLPQLVGSVRDPHRLRLAQSTISTRLLEIILGLMLLAAIAAIWAIDTRRTLPKNPCSIGAVISLLAGTSQILNENIIPTGSEHLSDQELVKQGTFSGFLFSLGWWTDDDGERKFGIGIGQAQKE